MPTIEQLASLSDEELAEWVRLQEAAQTLDRYDWESKARPEQLGPQGEWSIWLILAGRGWGKTRTGAEWIKKKALAKRSRWAVVAPTTADTRDTCMEGESGLLSILRPEEIAHWNRSMGELILSNGSRIKTFSGDEPDRLRGPQHHGAWVDELAAFRYPEAWDQLMFGLRLGDNPQTVITTTPRPTKLIRELVEREFGVCVTTGNTFDNAANLAPAALEELKSRYEGTRLGRQELYAEILTDVPGALWKLDMIDSNRVQSDKIGDLRRIVVGVDPAVTNNEDSDETGIVVCGMDSRGHVYVLFDRSLRASPDSWANEVLRALDDSQGDLITGEVNNGGDLVESVIRGVRRDAPYKAVRASRGKEIRAQPIVGYYERGEVHHVGYHAKLEEQCLNWVPGEGKSPDRVDALVWAITELKPVSAPRRTLSYESS